MGKNRAFWHFMMLGSIVGWIFVCTGLIVPFSGAIEILWLIICGIWVILHPLEIIVSLPIGKKAGVGPLETALKTVLFGFTWWLPVKKGILDR